MRNSIKQYANMTDKKTREVLDVLYSLQRLQIVSIAISVALVVICFFYMIFGTGNNFSAEKSNWIEILTENNIGYSVNPEWKTTSISGAVVFQPTDTIAISVSAQDIVQMNSTREDKLTSDNLLEFIQKDLTTLSGTDGVSVSDISYREYDILDTKGYYLTFTQTQLVEEQEVSTYGTAVFFIYDSYLYSFTFASAYKGLISEDYEKVLASIRVVPDTDDNMIDLSNVTLDPSIVSGFAGLGDDLESSLSAEVSDITTVEN